jgi:predicted lipid-binding transport protein (Tim44 family)
MGLILGVGYVLIEGAWYIISTYPIELAVLFVGWRIIVAMRVCTNHIAQHITQNTQAANLAAQRVEWNPQREFNNTWRETLTRQWVLEAEAEQASAEQEEVAE